MYLPMPTDLVVFFFYFIIDFVVFSCMFVPMLTDFVVFYLLPDGVSEVMRNKRAEKVNKIQAFARALPSMRFELRVLREDTQNSFRLVLLIKLTSCVCMLASPQKSA